MRYRAQPGAGRQTAESSYQLLKLLQNIVAKSRRREQLVVQNDTKQRAVDLQPSLRTAGVIDKAQFPEPVHKKTHPRTSCPDHFGQALLTDFRNHGLGHTILPKMSKQKQDSSQPLFAGVKQLVDQILFITNIPGEQIRHK